MLSRFGPALSELDEFTGLVLERLAIVPENPVSWTFCQDQQSIKAGDPVSHK
jgi:hypothetical protein